MSKQDEEVVVDDAIYHMQTRDAYCVSTEEDTFGNEAERIWLPKSLVHKDGDDFIMPEWLALEKGLI